MYLTPKLIIKYILMKKINCEHCTGDSRVSFDNNLGGGGGGSLQSNFYCKSGHVVIQNRYTSFEPDCYSYPLAHAKKYQLNGRRPESAGESGDYTWPRIQ